MVVCLVSLSGCALFQPARDIDLSPPGTVSLAGTGPQSLWKETASPEEQDRSAVEAERSRITLTGLKSDDAIDEPSGRMSDELSPTNRSSNVGQKVTLEQVITEARNSFSIRAGEENISQAQADFWTASLIPNPTLTIDTVLQPFPTRPFSVTKQGGPPQYDALLTMPLDWQLFGKRDAAMNAAQLATSVAARGVEELIRQRILISIFTFYDVLESRALVELSQEDVKNLEQIEQIMLNGIKLGDKATVELDRIRLALITSRRDLLQRQVVLAASKSTLQALMGRVDFSDEFEVEGTLAVDKPADSLNKDAVLALTESQRPDILLLRQTVDRAAADLKREQSLAYPEVTGMLGFTYQQQRTAIGFPDVPSYDAAITTTLPIFNRNQGNIRKAESALWQANLSLQSRLSELRAEIDQMVNAYEAYREVVTNTDPAQQSAALNVRDRVAKAFEAGDRPLSEVLDTQRAYRETARLLITGRSNYWKALNRINSSVAERLIE